MASVEVLACLDKKIASQQDMIDELVKALQWYIDEDEIIEGMEGNEYWVNSKHCAQLLVDKAKGMK